MSAKNTKRKRTGREAMLVYPPGCLDITAVCDVVELTERLRILACALEDVEVGAGCSYQALARYIAICFYRHLNPGVRYWSACCTIELVRIYTLELLFKDLVWVKEVFFFLMHELEGLQLSPEDPNIKAYIHMLDKAAYWDVFPDCMRMMQRSESVCCELFSTLFAAARKEILEVDAEVYELLLDIMLPIIEDQGVPQRLLEMVLSNAFKENESRNKTAYCLARDLIKYASPQFHVALERYVRKFVIPLMKP